MSPQMCRRTRPPASWRPSGGDLAGDGVAHAHRVGARVELRAAEGDAHLDAQVHQLACVAGVEHQVHQEVRRAAQGSSFGRGAFNPAEDRVDAVAPVLEGLDAADAVEHALGAVGVGRGELREVLVVLERWLEAAGHAVADELDVGAEALGLAVGVGDGAELVEAEVLDAALVGLDEHAIVGGEGPIVRADELGGELHEDGQSRQQVGPLAVEHGHVAIVAGHSSSFAR